MGISYVDGICDQWYSCVLIEFTPTDSRDRTYPSTGFGSAIVAAHELAHNLGTAHDADSVGSRCDLSQFIMAAIMNAQGHSVWSPCSAQALERAPHPCLQDRHPEDTRYHVFNEHPAGLDLDAAAQCAVLLRDRSAFVDMDDRELICNSIKSVFYYN